MLLNWIFRSFRARCDCVMCVRCGAHETQQNHKLCLLLSFDIYFTWKKNKAAAAAEREREMRNVCDWNVQCKRWMRKSAALYAEQYAVYRVCTTLQANLIMACENTQNERACFCVCVGNFYEIICLSLAFIFRVMFRFFLHERHIHTHSHTEKKRWANCITMIMLLWGWKWKNEWKSWPSFNTLCVLCIKE